MDELLELVLEYVKASVDNCEGAPPPQLTISPDPLIDAFATGIGTVQINLALSEPISDSPSELAFAVAHELGHIVQNRTNHVGSRAFFNTNIEFDADAYGMFFSLAAGFDPYAACGTLAKLSLATNQAGLVAQLFDNFSGDCTIRSTSGLPPSIARL